MDIPVTPSVRRLRQEHHGLKANIGYMPRSCLKGAEVGGPASSQTKYLVVLMILLTSPLMIRCHIHMHAETILACKHIHVLLFQYGPYSDVSEITTATGPPGQCRAPCVSFTPDGCVLVGWEVSCVHAVHPFCSVRACVGVHGCVCLTCCLCKKISLW